tara:strand:+ start:696 stop:965 length:270 start_codon:yes stop_codon:yes gene_type:complete
MAGKDVYKVAQGIPSSAGPTGDTTIYGVAIYNGHASGTGSIGVQTVNGQNIQFKNVPAGSILPVHHSKVYGVTADAALRTTATNIISLL